MKKPHLAKHHSLPDFFINPTSLNQFLSQSIQLVGKACPSTLRLSIIYLSIIVLLSTFLTACAQHGNAQSNTASSPANSLEQFGTTLNAPVGNNIYNNGQTIQITGLLQKFGPDRTGFLGLRTSNGQVWQLSFNSAEDAQRYASLLNASVIVTGMRIEDSLNRPQIKVYNATAAP